MTAARDLLRQASAGLRTLLVLTVILGLAYPALLLAVGLVVPGRANGSMLEVDGKPAGSSLIGQSFEGDQWFLPRPSVAGDGYDAQASGGSNLGPNSEELLETVRERTAAVAEREGVPASKVPPDAVTASASGLDPDISPAYAALQVSRVAEARGLSVQEVTSLVSESTAGRDAGIIGEPTVNVVTLNAALVRQSGAGQG